MNLRGTTDILKEKHNEREGLRQNRRQLLLQSKRLQSEQMMVIPKKVGCKELYQKMNLQSITLKEMYNIILTLEEIIEASSEVDEFDIFIETLIKWIINSKDIMLRYHVITVFVLIAQKKLVPHLKNTTMNISQLIISQTNHSDLLDRTLRLVGFYFERSNDIEDYNKFLEIIHLIENKKRIDKNVLGTVCWALFFVVTRAAKQNPTFLQSFFPYIASNLDPSDDNIEGNNCLLICISQCIEYKVDYIVLFDQFTHFLSKLVLFLKTGVEKLVLPALHVIGQIIGCSDDYTEVFVNDGLIDTLFSIFESLPPDTILSEAMWVLRNLFIPEGNPHAIYLIEKGVVQYLIRYVYRQNIQFARNAVWALTTAILSCKLRQDMLQKMISIGVVQPIIYVLKNRSLFTSDDVLNCVDSILCLMIQDNVSPQIGSRNAFEESNIIDMLEELTDDKMIQGFTRLKIELLKSYFSPDRIEEEMPLSL
ncbi:hypothetical protein, conserved [Entamoeba dispar SAW760]|uniref:Importin alpha subunit n=1 Tax=Entamoeba dispar (strain ATCC PRA-260 / SAW760) TaxID=370354 RepID=B0EFE5_ENTDS|nr:uncharacterized protein EDI_049250 [Entamoeba dispar SAW760]EDR26724.1 hypothetical protein, conserved [Entamoeba dispar SAW760]|eukprot:EDR26724.1 hypothetical protein, conserved [Entamoeba dispar SAW760]